MQYNAKQQFTMHLLALTMQNEWYKYSWLQ